jgi:hypothetical protein
VICEFWPAGCSSGSTTAISAASATTTAIAAATTATDSSSGRSSPYAMATAAPWIGIASGTMIIAPMTVAVESPITPVVAIAVDSTSRSQNRLCLAPTSPTER